MPRRPAGEDICTSRPPDTASIGSRAATISSAIKLSSSMTMSRGAEKPRNVAGSPGSETTRAPFASSQLDRLSSSKGSTGSRLFKSLATLPNSSFDCRKLGDTKRIRPGS
jgi:hypothetical protein